MKYFKYVIFTFFLAALAGCFGGSDDTSKDEDNTSESAGSVMDQLSQVQKQMEDMAKGKAVDPINFRELQKGMPDNVGRFDRVDMSGQTSGSMGFTISQVETEYKKGEDERVKVNVVDAGGIAMATSMLAAWTLVTIDKEDSRGYEKTTKFMGYPAYEKYYKDSKQSELSMFINERIVLTANSYNMEMDDLKSFIKDLGPKRFEKML